MKKRLYVCSTVLLALLPFCGCPVMSNVAAPDAGARSPIAAERVVATPVISTSVGASGMSELLTICCETPGAAISYSADDGRSWQPYDGPVTLYTASSIQASAAADGYADSEIASAGGFHPRAIVVPFVFFKGEVATLRSSSTVIYSQSNIQAPGTWKVYTAPIGLTETSTLAVQGGMDRQGHPVPAPVRLSDDVNVTVMASTTSLADDWSSYSTDLWVTFSSPVQGTVTRAGEACVLEQPEVGNFSKYVIRAAAPGIYEVQMQSADHLYFRFQYVSGDATAEMPDKPPSEPGA
jgi:hypothetical protein